MPHKEINSKRPLPSLKDRKAHGKFLRSKVPREEHSRWIPAQNRPDPIAILEKSNAHRIQHLLGIRHGRMLKSPFTYFRGAADVMAGDLVQSPVSGIVTQLCGDCHLMNFGAYGTPERNMIVDINDFDETLPGPWEWDLKRLAASFVLACRADNFKASVAMDAVLTLVRSYRMAMSDFALMSRLELWYTKMSLDSWLAGIDDKEYVAQALSFFKKQEGKTSTNNFPKITDIENGQRKFRDNPPLIYHPVLPEETCLITMVEEAFVEYEETLVEDRRILLDNYQIVDAAIRVGGIGSVGTLCGILLLMAADNDPLILQFKEAGQSVLEPHLGKSLHKNHGERVVTGQRLMQSHSDIFIGWTKSATQGKHFFIRQLKDMKMSITPENWIPARAMEVAKSLGWILARAHGRSSDAAVMSGYMGSSDVLDEAIAHFAMTYADQSERDHHALELAVKSGRIQAEKNPY